MSGRVTREEVRAALDVPRLLEALDLGPFRASGNQLRSRRCPADRHSTAAFAISAATGQWICHVCGTDGDFFHLVADAYQLDRRADFRRIVDLAGEILGVVPSASDEERQQREAALAQRQQELRAEESRLRELAIASVPYAWASLLRYDPLGAAYLARRGLDPHALIAAGAVRFDEATGSPAVLLRDFDGRWVNVATRMIEPGEGPKAPVRAGCPVRGTLVGSVRQVRPGSTVVIAEGVTDSLAAVLAWPGAVVLGAHSAGQYAAVADAIAPAVREAGATVVLVADADAAGIVAASNAYLALDLAGVSSERVDLRGAKDLTEAWASGWRP